MPGIPTYVEAARGCGYRQPGGLYLVGNALAEPCPRLPFPLDKCPHCGQGIRPSRTQTWFTPAIIVPGEEHGSYQHNAHCPLGMSDSDHIDALAPDPLWHRTGETALLIWVGEGFYPTAESFREEAAQMGVSRRLVAYPRGFKIGEHWCYLGHRKAVVMYPDTPLVVEQGQLALAPVPDPVYSPGLFAVFKPRAIEYVLREGEDQDKELLERLERRGISPVRVERAPAEFGQA